MKGLDHPIRRVELWEVARMIAEVVAIPRKEHREIGVSGQAPGDSPEFGPFLVEQGYDGISLNPDPVFTTTLAALETERKTTKK